MPSLILFLCILIIGIHYFRMVYIILVNDIADYFFFDINGARNLRNDLLKFRSLELITKHS